MARHVESIRAGFGPFFFFLQIGLRSGSAPFIVPKYAQTVNMLFPPCSLGIRFFWAKSVVSACAGSKASTRCEAGVGGDCEGTGRMFGVDAIKCAN